MATLTIHSHSPNSNTCALCGRNAKAGSGLRLGLADTDHAVCRDCGKCHAPALVALLDLASVAERVGRIGRHTLVPPMAALLDLARAAEMYTENRAKPAFRKAA
jgi:hypothetical protein